MTLRSDIQSLTETFVQNLLAAVRGATLQDLLSSDSATPGAKKAPKPAGARQARRSSEDIGDVVNRITEALAGAPNGLRAEDIRKKLGIESKEMVRPLAVALKEKRITKSGKKRATVYTLPVKVPTKKAAPAKKAAPKKKATPKKAKKAAPKKDNLNGAAEATPAAE
jgi:hypothetical protein